MVPKEVTPKYMQHVFNMTARTVRSAAQEMDIHERTLHRYLSGELPIPKLVQLVIEYWAQKAYRAEGRARMRCAHPHKALMDDGNAFWCPGCRCIVGFLRLPTKKKP